MDSLTSSTNSTDSIETGDYVSFQKSLTMYAGYVSEIGGRHGRLFCTVHIGQDIQGHERTERVLLSGCTLVAKQYQLEV